MEHDATKYDLLKTEFLLAQQQMDKYDQLCTTVKTWSITLWTASAGWAIQTKAYQIFLLGIFAVVFFWVLDAYHKTVRQNYKKRRNEVAVVLRKYYDTGAIPPEASSPVLPVQGWTHFMQYFFSIHIALPYFVMIIISLSVYLVFSL